MQSRYYNPEWGRFINADASDILETKLGELLEQNIFLYCTNNPIMHVDPSGYSKLDIKQGYEFMETIYDKYNGLIKNTESFFTSYGNRKPDIINGKIIGEIKDVAYQSLTKQIKGFMELAQNSGKKFVLIVSQKATLSKPLQKAISDINGKVVVLGRDASRIRISPPIIVFKRQVNNFMRQFDQNAVY